MNNKKCPVCGSDLSGHKRDMRVKNRKVSVCCDECAKKVREEPSKYAKAR